MYNSPINIIYGQMQTQMEGDILRAVQQYGIDVDKEELIRALRYDRDQYNQGYDNGRKDAIASIVHCKECRYYKQNPYAKSDDKWCQYWVDWKETYADDFCSYGQKAERNRDIETNCFDF